MAQAARAERFVNIPSAAPREVLARCGPLSCRLRGGRSRGSARVRIRPPPARPTSGDGRQSSVSGLGGRVAACLPCLRGCGGRQDGLEGRRNVKWCLIGMLEEKNCYKCSIISHRARRCEQRAPDVGKADVCVCGGGARWCWGWEGWRSFLLVAKPGGYSCPTVHSLMSL